MSMPDKSPTTTFWRDLLPFLILGAILRFWNFGEMPFTNDELSALHRTSFPDFRSLVSEGITPDAHPALTQVFLWIWVRLFGTTTWLIRLPFVAAGLASIAIVFRLAIRAFNPGTAQVAAALMAGSQIFVYFSDVARPYAFGMLICSALAWCWYRCVFEEQPKLRPHIWLALLISLSVYNHYFSGLLGILIWLSGWFFSGRIHKIYYSGSAALAFLLFLPHLPISLAQLEHKGVGSWLRPPAPDFIWEWFMSLINYSTALVVVTAGLLAWKTVGMFLNKPRSGSRPAVVFFIWFAATYTIGYSYSILIDPLLHHGALLFASPFLCLALAFFITPRSPILAKAAAYIISALLTFSLVWEREHFEVFEQQRYAKVAEQLKETDAEGVPALAIVSQNPVYLARYVDLNSLGNTRVINLSTHKLGMAELMDEIRNPGLQRLYLDGRHWALTTAAKETRILEKKSNGFTFTGHHFSTQGKPDTAVDHVLTENFERETFSGEKLEIYKAKLDTTEFTFADHIAAVVRFDLSGSTSITLRDADLQLVIAFRKNGEPEQTRSVAPIGSGYQQDGTLVLVHQLLLWDFYINPREMLGVEAEVYLRNPKGSTITVESLKVKRVEGNPYLYGQLNRMP